MRRNRQKSDRSDLFSTPSSVLPDAGHASLEDIQPAHLESAVAPPSTPTASAPHRWFIPSVSRVTLSCLALTGLVYGVMAPGEPVSAAATDNNVEWDGVFSDTTAQFVSPMAVKVGQSVTLKLRARASDLTGVVARIWLSGPNQEQRLNMTRTAPGGRFDLWSVSLTVPTGTTQIYYRFELTDGTDTDYYDAGASTDAWTVRGMSDAYRGDDYNFRVRVDFDTPAWSKEAVAYQVFPDRFYDGDSSNNKLFPDDCFWYLDYAPALGTAPECAAYTVPQAANGYAKNCEVHDAWNEAPNGGPCDFFGGDLQGVTTKLGYIKDLGVTQLYLNPVFRSPSNHKYDTMDYEEVDPRFGSNAAMESLVSAASSAGLYTVADGVFNHGSDLGRQYNGYLNYAYNNGTITGVDAYPSVCGAWESSFAKSCTSSPYSDWFKIWTGTDQYDVDRDGNKSEAAAHTCGWYGFEFMPDFDYKSNAVAPNSGPRTWLYGGTSAGTKTGAESSIAGKWLMDGGKLSSGIDGWRLDVPDNAGYFTNSTSGDCSKADNDPSIWSGFRTATKTIGQSRLIIGEIWTDASVNRNTDYTGVFDGVMNYHFFGMPMSCFLTGTGVHNDPNECVDSYAALTLGKSASVDALDAHLATQRRVYPAAFYMSSWNLLSSHDTSRFASRANGDAGKYKTAVLFQATLPGAPMLYYGDEVGVTGANNEQGRATFPWTSLDNSTSTQAVLREYVRSLMCVRKSYPALSTGSFITLWTNNAEKTYGFGRWDGNDQVAVAINTDGVTRTIRLAVERLDQAEGAKLVDVLTGTSYTVASGSVTLQVPARSGAILVPELDSAAGIQCMDRNDAPTANAGGDLTITEGETALLSGVASKDPEGAALKYVWKDSITGTVIGTTAQVEVSGLALGSYTYILTVSDGVYSASADATVTVTAAGTDDGGGNCSVVGAGVRPSYGLYLMALLSGGVIVGSRRRRSKG